MDSLIKIGEALLLVACIALIIFIGLRYISGHKYAKSIFGGRKIVERSPDIPMEGNLLAASYILDNADFLDTPHLNANLSAAFLFRWYLEGKVKFDDGLLAFTEGPEPQDKFEKGIYRIFRKAAGDDLLIDELDEVKRVFYLEGDNVPRDYAESGKLWFKKRGYIEKDGMYTPTLSDAGQKEARGLLALRNYLEDVKSGQETIMTDNGHLTDYVVYSILFDFDDLFVESVRNLLTQEQIYACKAAKDLAKAAEDAWEDYLD